MDGTAVKSAFAFTFGESNKALWRLKRRPYYFKEDKSILDNQRKQNNNEIRSLTAEYKKSEPERRGSIYAAIKRGKEICDRRDELYESQQEIKHKLWKLEREI